MTESTTTIADLEREELEAVAAKALRELATAGGAVDDGVRLHAAAELLQYLTALHRWRHHAEHHELHHQPGISHAHDEPPTVLRSG